MSVGQVIHPSSFIPHPSPWPHRAAWLLACATFPLIVMGGMVTSFGAGMAVPDWPSTYGYNLFLYPLASWLHVWDVLPGAQPPLDRRVGGDDHHSAGGLTLDLRPPPLGPLVGRGDVGRRLLSRGPGRTASDAAFDAPGRLARLHGTAVLRDVRLPGVGHFAPMASRRPARAPSGLRGGWDGWPLWPWWRSTCKSCWGPRCGTCRRRPGLFGSRSGSGHT